MGEPAALHSEEEKEEEVLDGYQVLRTIGHGSFGWVKLAQHLQSGSQVAVKIIAEQDQASPSLQQVWAEVEIMKGMHHPNIIRLQRIEHTTDRVYIFMDYASQGDLEKYVAEHGRLREGAARLMFNQTLSAVHYCHSKHIVHRDLKLENLLLDAGLNIKLTDFGLSCRLREGQQLESFCGTPQYCAPEEFLDEEFDGYKTDVWSLGVALYTMTTGALPFTGKNWAQLEDSILSGCYQVPSHMSLELEHLVEWLLTYDPKERPKVADFMGHQWLSLGQKEPETSQVALGSPQEKEIRDCLVGLGAQAWVSRLSPRLCWEKSQRQDSARLEPREITNVEPFGSPQDPEVQKYLAGLGFSLGYREHSLLPSCGAGPRLPVLQRSRARGKRSPLAAPLPQRRHVAQRFPDCLDCRGSAREQTLPMPPLLLPKRDRESEPSARWQGFPRTDGHWPGMLRRSPTPRPPARPGPSASLITRSDEDQLEGGSCSWAAVAEKESSPERQLVEDAGSLAAPVAKSQGRQGLCRRIMNFLLQVCGVLPAPEAPG